MFVAIIISCFGAPMVFSYIPLFPEQSTDELQSSVVSRYFRSSWREIVLVGSSLTFRLRESFFDGGNVFNFALPGGSPLTAMAIIGSSPARRPSVVVVETNVPSRGIDQALLQKFGNARRPSDILRPARTLAAIYQIHVDPLLRDPSRETLLRTPPSDVANTEAVARTLAEFNNPLADAFIMKQAPVFKELVDKLEAMGVRVFLFEQPVAPALRSSRLVMKSREAISRCFDGDDPRWLKPSYPADQLRWDDGQHLDERSAVIFASALERAISAKLHGSN